MPPDFLRTRRSSITERSYLIRSWRSGGTAGLGKAPQLPAHTSQRILCYTRPIQNANLFLRSRKIREFTCQDTSDDACQLPIKLRQLYDKMPSHVNVSKGNHMKLLEKRFFFSHFAYRVFF